MEHMYPSLTYICIITGISAVSNFTQFVFVGPNFGGLSGLLYGLFGYLWIYGWKNPNAVFKLTQATVIIFLIWYILCWTGLLGNIANWAHTGGLLTGMLLGFIAASTYTAKNSKFDTFNNIDL
jgi:GlpG protein